VNVEGVRRLVAACAQVASPPRLLHVSSLAAKAPHVSPYAASKRAGEQVLEASTGIAWTIFRPPAVYGPGDRELKGLFRTMARGIGPYPGSLDSRVSLMHVDDLVAAVLAWLEHADTARRLFELDDGCRGGYAWRDVLETMERVSGRSMLRVRLPKGLMMALGYANLGLARVMRGAPMLTPGKVRELYQSAWVADARDVEEALDWHPSVSLESGLRALLEAAG
jgi:nucleoside-diphosphate-sugar epimerase